jgi:hypothetical protein
MKYCTKCGSELPQPNPRFCQQCGTKIAVAAAGGEKTGKQDKAKPAGKKTTPAQAAWALALLAAFLFIALIWPFTYWEAAGSACTQHYQYLTAFGKDAAWMHFASDYYDSIPLDNYTYNAKANAAAAYALNAKQALTSWNYTLSFLRLNDGLLSSCNISAASAEANITGEISAAGAKAASMENSLSGFAAANASLAEGAKSMLRDVKAQASAIK